MEWRMQNPSLYQSALVTIAANPNHPWLTQWCHNLSCHLPTPSRQIFLSKSSVNSKAQKWLNPIVKLKAQKAAALQGATNSWSSPYQNYTWQWPTIRYLCFQSIAMAGGTAKATRSNNVICLLLQYVSHLTAWQPHCLSTKATKAYICSYWQHWPAIWQHWMVCPYY